MLEIHHAPLAHDQDAPLIEIVISDFAFDPPHVTVPRGTSIAWINKEHGELHSVCLFEPRLETWKLDMRPGERFERDFAELGLFTYYCSIYPFMKVIYAIERPPGS